MKQAKLWDTKARDWAEFQQPQHRPLYEAVFRKTGVVPRTLLLDIGCGGGVACAIAAKMGARVAGIDASQALIDIAKGLVPEGGFRKGEMEELPYADNSFDVVTGFNAFQYAADPPNALKEARRVSRPGSPVVIATLGKPEDCEVASCLAALRPLLPPPPPGAAGPFALSQDGALEALANQAGLAPILVDEVNCPWTYSDLQKP